MIYLYIVNHKFHYEMENLIRVFYPNEKIEKIYDDENLQGDFVYTSIDENITVRLSVSGFDKTLETKKDVKDKELEMAILLYRLLVEQSNKNQPWGLLTGIRPVKLFDNISKEEGPDNTEKIFREKFFVSENKTKLTREIYEVEKKIKDESENNSFSLYVSIPFCPSRCNYCSFVSSSVEKIKHIVPKYIELLLKEIEYTAKLVDKAKLKLKSVYIGGGTPTTLSSDDLQRIINKIKEEFDFSDCVEFTVEAGRPDTITREKLLMLKDSNVTRISINPQTLNDEVLRIIGRKHTSKETIDAFNLARDVGIDNINMDLIAGLQGDTYESFVDTIEGILKLSPESVTVHTLALKSGSNTFMKGGMLNQDYAKMTEMMVDYSRKRLCENQYIPYYMYRQSKMLGNLENVGYSKRGYESYYNIYIMEETHTILACGAGSVSKLKDPNSNYLERIFNFKYPYEYIDRFDEMLKRKDRLIDFCNQYL